MKSIVTSSLIVATLAIPLAASAAMTDNNTSTQMVSGVIRSIDGKYGLTVRDNSGSLDSVALHKGTIINPTGADLRQGLAVTIVGRADGRSFDADTINAPANAANHANQDSSSTDGIAPVIPPGTFETEGPTAEGGG
jgi:hypothetical protein